MFRTKRSVTLYLVTIALTIKFCQPFWFISNESSEDTSNSCIEEPLEAREQKATVVVTAKVLDVGPDPYNEKLKVANVQVKRVFKGTDVVFAISDERPGVVSEDTFNKVIAIYGIGETTICHSNVNEGDTKIFMLNLEYFGNLRISSSIIPISSYNLDKTDAAVRDIPFDKSPPKKSPCVGFFCPFHARCFLNATSNSPYCACLDDCVDHVTSPVCGTDRTTYNNECLLRLSSCQRQRRIKVEHDGPCYDPCDGVKCQGQQVCKLNKEREAVCQCEASCEQTVAPVCGSDGTTYSNECMLRQRACQDDREITVLYPAECRESQEPCRGVQCEFDGVCVVRDEKPQCECPTCKDQYDPVCGDNGISYENECMMHKENCEKKKKTRKEHRGLCMINGCDKNNTVCQFYSVCETDGVVSRCVCPDHCEKTDANVCGTDGVTYDSECELRVASCKQHMHIYIMSYGACEACNGVKCKFGARCENGRCVCPFLCPREYEPVCASDGNTYPNDCEMRKEACQKNQELEVVHLGECEDLLGPEGSGGRLSDPKT